MPKIQIKRGEKSSLPRLSEGELGLARDANELYIGGTNDNIQVATLQNGKLPSGLLESLSISLNGGTNTTYDGSTAETLTISPDTIGSPVCRTLTMEDFNNAVEPGLYTMRNAQYNQPVDTSYWGLLVLKSDNGSYIEQLAIQEEHGAVYVRCCSGSRWTEWKRMDSGDWDSIQNKPSFSSVAYSGNYGDLVGAPTSLPANGGNADSVGGWEFYATSIQLNPCSVTTAYGNMYVSQEYNFAYGPATGTPYVTATCQSNGYAYAHISYSTNQNRVYFRVINPVQTSSLNAVVHFHIMWKNE
jgi:hypothetical protein